MEYLKSFKLFESVTKHIFNDRTEYRNGKGQRHRKGGPAIEYVNGNEYWYINGKLHRVNGHAVEYADGGKEWYLNDKRHRVDGPAVEYSNGHKGWYLNGKRHREDGPSIEYVDGSKDWYLNDKSIPESKFIQTLTHQLPNLNLFKDLPIEDLEELSADLCDRYDGKIKKWENFYVIYFKEKLDPNDHELKSFENRIKDFRIRINNKSILVY